jgi:hypothetical protein
VTKTDGPRAALVDGDATSVATAVGDGLAEGGGLADGEAAGVVHAITSAPTNKPAADRITRQYAVECFPGQVFGVS